MGIKSNVKNDRSIKSTKRDYPYLARFDSDKHVALVTKDYLIILETDSRSSVQWRVGKIAENYVESRWIPLHPEEILQMSND